MARLSFPDALAELHWHMVTDPRHGYSQPNRYGDGTRHNVTLSDGTVYQCRGGDKDCSSSIAEAVGQLLGTSWPFTYTGDQRAGLLGTGKFKIVPVAERRRGDIVMNDGHTAIIQSAGKVSEFSRSEHYSITGTKGDQDGWESHVGPDKGHWHTCFHYIGPAREAPTAGEIQAEQAAKAAEEAAKRAAETEDVMACIIRIKDKAGHYYFDGSKMHPIKKPEELAVLDKAYALATGKKELPRAIWPESEIIDLLRVLSY